MPPHFGRSAAASRFALCSLSGAQKRVFYPHPHTPFGCSRDKRRDSLTQRERERERPFDDARRVGRSQVQTRAAALAKPILSVFRCFFPRRIRRTRAKFESTKTIRIEAWRQFIWPITSIFSILITSLGMIESLAGYISTTASVFIDERRLLLAPIESYRLRVRAGRRMVCINQHVADWGERRRCSSCGCCRC